MQVINSDNFLEWFMSVSFKRLALSAMLLSLCLGNAAKAQNAEATMAVDSIVAIVDEDVILRSELERAVNNVKVQYAKQAGQLPPEAILEKQVLERLILQRLQVNRAKEIGIRVSDAELNQTVQSIASSNKMTVEQFQQRVGGLLEHLQICSRSATHVQNS